MRGQGKNMKRRQFVEKTASIILTLALIVSGQLITASAQENEMSNLKESYVEINEKENIKLSEDAYLIDSVHLLGTELEGDTVLVTRDNLFVNGQLRSNSVEVFLGGLLIGWLIDGVIIYASGYSGAALAATTIGMIISFVAAHPVILVIAVTVLVVTASSIQKYKTSNGNECVLQPSGNGYYCKFSLEV